MARHPKEPGRSLGHNLHPRHSGRVGIRLNSGKKWVASMWPLDPPKWTSASSPEGVLIKPPAAAPELTLLPLAPLMGTATWQGRISSERAW